MIFEETKVKLGKGKLFVVRIKVDDDTEKK